MHKKVKDVFLGFSKDFVENSRNDLKVLCKLISNLNSNHHSNLNIYDENSDWDESSIASFQSKSDSDYDYELDDEDFSDDSVDLSEETDNVETENGTENNNNYSELWTENDDITDEDEVATSWTDIDETQEHPLKKDSSLNLDDYTSNQIYDLFVTQEMLEMIVLETNRYAEQVLDSRAVKRSARDRKWI